MKLIYGDVETGGLDSYEHKILEVGLVLSEDGVELDHFHSVINPGEAYLERTDIDGALAINGITREQMRAAPFEVEVVERMREFIERAIAAGWEREERLHSYNRPFDAGFLGQPPWMVPDEWWGECVMRAAAPIVNPQTRRWPKLVHSAAHFNLEWPGRAHGALSDARMASMVHHAIMIRRQT